MIKEILGTDLSTFVIWFYYAFIGIAFSLLSHAVYRDQGSTRTPQTFSLSFLLKDNWKRIAFTVLELYIFFRFFPELTGKQLTSWLCCASGLCLDKISQVIKTRANFLNVN